jgi:hypothetical protein
VTPRRTALTVADLRMETVARLAAGAALFVVAASFTYSFAQIKWVSDQLGVEQGWLSYLFPLIIDAPALVASALTVALHTRPIRVRQYAWTVLVLFTAASWACNAIHALTFSSIDVLAGPAGNVLVVLIAGFPPVGVVLGVHLWAFALRHSPGADQRAPVSTERSSGRNARANTAAERPTERSPEPARERVSAPVSAQAERPDTAAPAPARPPASPPAGAPVSAQPARKPASNATIEATARSMYAELLPETPPGQPVDAAELRRRLIGEFGEEAVPSAQTVRRWRAAFAAEHQAAAETAPTSTPEPARRMSAV